MHAACDISVARMVNQASKLGSVDHERHEAQSCDIDQRQTEHVSCPRKILTFLYLYLEKFRSCCHVILKLKGKYFPMSNDPKIDISYLAILIFFMKLHLMLIEIGDSLVFIFPLATMLTFTSAVGKLNVRVLWHHHMLLQVISQSYCQVFVKSYNFVFEQIDKEGSPREK